MEEAAAALLDLGVEDRVLRAGDAAPVFELPDATTGRMVRSGDLLAMGPLVVTFFRGRWCPYCMTELGEWQRLYTQVRRRGALLVAISPQQPRQNGFTADQHHLTFPLLADAGNRVASSFGLTWTVPPKLQQHFRSILVNIPHTNGDASWQLPLPGTFVLRGSASEASVVWAEAYADHRVRPEPSRVLDFLDGLSPE